MSNIKEVAGPLVALTSTLDLGTTVSALQEQEKTGGWLA